MRLLFVVSANIWAWLVGRTIAFGPAPDGLWWCPRFSAESWYRLTAIPCAMPYKWLTGVPWVLIACSTRPLLINDNLIHSVTVLLLTSEHCHVVIFCARRHTKWIMVVWSLVHIVANAILALLVGAYPLGCVWKTALHCWFLVMEMSMSQNIVRNPIAYVARTPRIV